MSPLVKRYRQTTHGDLYTVEYRLQPNGTYKLFCLDHPYNPLSADVHSCHLYSSGEICVSSSYRVDSLGKAKAVAAAFIDAYSTYIRTGQAPNGAKRVHV
jgi:hypothetical protein